MAIIGLTHNEDLSPRVSRSITTKVAIGLAPQNDKDHPKRLDHFVFLQKGLRNGKPGWFPNEEMAKHFGQNPREVWITFLDNDVDTVFRTSFAAYVQRGCWCKGDGVNAQRRGTTEEIKAGKWPDFVPFAGPCANTDAKGNHCPFIDNRKCAPSGDLYFMLADFPALGSICRLHTSSYQSIRQIYSGLIDIKNVSGGRLMGLTAKLFVHPDKSIFEQEGKARSGVKHVLGIEVRADDIRSLQTRMLDTAMTFQNIKGLLGGQTVVVDENDEERGEELTAEFYSDRGGDLEGEVIEGEPVRRVEAENTSELEDEAHALMTRLAMNKARRDAEIGKNKARLREFVEELKAKIAAREKGPGKAGNATDSSLAGGGNAGGTRVDAAADAAAKKEEAMKQSGKKNPPRKAEAAPEVSDKDPMHVTHEDAASVSQPQQQPGFDF